MMTPEEIVAELNTKNRVSLYTRKDFQSLTPDQVLALMNDASMQGFRLGSRLAMSIVKGAVLVQLTRSRKGDAADTSNISPET